MYYVLVQLVVLCLLTLSYGQYPSTYAHQTKQDSKTDDSFQVRFKNQAIGATDWGVYDVWIRIQGGAAMFYYTSKVSGRTFYVYFFQFLTMPSDADQRIEIQYLGTNYFQVEEFDKQGTSLQVVQTKYANSLDGWHNLKFGWQQSTGKACLIIDRNIVEFATTTNITLTPNLHAHPTDGFNAWKFRLSSSTYFFWWQEQKMWKLTDAEFNSIDFTYRYYGVSFKTGAYPSQLTNYYEAQATASDIDKFPSSIDPTTLNGTSVNNVASSWIKPSPTMSNVYLTQLITSLGTQQLCSNLNSRCSECSQDDAGTMYCYSCTGENAIDWSTHICRPACTPGFYPSGINCVACVSPCSVCESATICLSCVTGFNYINDGTKKCVAAATGCPTGLQLDANYPLCQRCQYPCDTCSSNGVSCLTCKSGFLLSGTSCVKDCPSTQYFDQTTQKCLDCDTTCATCRGSSTYCTSCKSGTFLDQTVLTSLVCSTTCPTGFYGDATSKTCMKCEPACDTCVGKNYTCTACKSPNLLLGDSCVTACPLLYYWADTTNKKCAACDTRCKICITSATDCSDCTPGSLLSNRKCIGGCDPQFYSPPGVAQCFPCDPSCYACTDSRSTSCSICNPTFFLLGTECMSLCPDGYYGDVPTKTCLPCPFFCTKCSSPTVCSGCQPGFKKTSTFCQGISQFPTTATFSMTVNTNTAVVNTYEPTAITIEAWIKGTSMATSGLQVILGLSPYKLRKKSGMARFQLHYNGLLAYCDTATDISSNTWHHFAFAVNENPSDLKCYLDGVIQANGGNSIGQITQNVVNPSEITFGGTNNVAAGENKFEGFLREFRWWNIQRDSFKINGFKGYSFSTIPTTMVAYWRLDEKNDGTATKFTDSAQGGTITLTPTLPATVSNIMQTKMIDTILCGEGSYPNYSITLGYYVCSSCHYNCKNCIGPTSNNCTECTEPLKILVDMMQCVQVSSCPSGYYQNSVSGVCEKCNKYCAKCIGSPDFCPSCLTGTFRQGSDCIASCSDGMYGQISNQQCYLLPQVTSLTPAHDSVFSYGTIVDLTASFKMMNNEPSTQYTYGWQVIRQAGLVDISADVIKTYYKTDILRVHMDNNILQPNNYYNVTFFVKGNSKYFTNMYASRTARIFFGIPPQKGKCKVDLSSGFAFFTPFVINASEWTDAIGIKAYQFYYSFDNGDIYVPIQSIQPTNQTLTYTFDPIYEDMKVKIKCEVINNKGFKDSVVTQITLQKRSNANAQNDLNKFDLSTVSAEAECLQKAQQLKLLIQTMGKLNASTPVFDPKLDFDDCYDKTCNYNGECNYLNLKKKYYCDCKKGFSGQNCSFTNATAQHYIQNLTLSLTILYNGVISKVYPIQFLKLTTGSVEQLSDVSVSLASDLVGSQITQWKGLAQSQDTLQQYTNIVSNLMEYIEVQVVRNNVTKEWTSVSADATNYQFQIDKLYSHITRIKNNSLYQIDQVTTSIFIISRMVTYRQVLLTNDLIYYLKASNETLKSKMTYVKLTNINFQGSVYMEPTYIGEAVEYAMNPFEVKTVSAPISTNVFEINLYNSSTKAHVSVSGLANPFEIYFPVSDNANLTTFATKINNLNPYKRAQLTQRKALLTSSQINCTYWSGTDWASDGCTFKSIDNYQIICLCNHLTMFGPRFYTPNYESSSAATSALNVTRESGEDDGPITLGEIMVPIAVYWPNLQELLQHKQPTILSFFMKPGLYLIIIFWFFYISGLIYYGGRDRQKRIKMTKAQIRDDLAELNDKELQKVDVIVKDMIMRDNALNSPRKALDSPQPNKHKGNKKTFHLTPHNEDVANLETQNNELGNLIIYEELPKDKKKYYKDRARKKVFGRVGGLWERAYRFHEKTFRHNAASSETKMKFFYAQINTNLWCSLMANTSKIAPRHVRLTLMYFNASMYLITTVGMYITGVNFMVSDSMFQILFVSLACLIAQIPFTFLIALIFRMPRSKRKLVEGLRAKKINKAFLIVDQLMGCRYAVGYCICLTFFTIATGFTLFFNYLYPSDYVMNWFLSVAVLFFLDLSLFTFGIAGLQLFNALLSQKVKCWKKIWAFFEVIRYVKNLKG